MSDEAKNPQQWSKADINQALTDLEDWCNGTPLDEEYMISAIRQVIWLLRQAT